MVGHAQCWEETGTGPTAGALSGLTACIMGVQSRPAQGAGARGRGFWHLDHSLEVAQTVLRSSHATGPQGRPDAPCPHCGCKRTCWAMWLFGVPPPTCAPAAAGCLLGLRQVRLTAAITTAPEVGLSLSALTQLCQPHCAARAWALSLPGTPAQRGTWPRNGAPMLSMMCTSHPGPQEPS